MTLQLRADPLLLFPWRVSSQEAFIAGVSAKVALSCRGQREGAVLGGNRNTDAYSKLVFNLWQQRASQAACPRERIAKTENKSSSPSCFPKATLRGVPFATTFGKPASLAVDYNLQLLNV